MISIHVQWLLLKYIIKKKVASYCFCGYDFHDKF